jgi:hypothetical protein
MVPQTLNTFQVIVDLSRRQLLQGKGLPERKKTVDSL